MFAHLPQPRQQPPSREQNARVNGPEVMLMLRMRYANCRMTVVLSPSNITEIRPSGRGEKRKEKTGVGGEEEGEREEAEEEEESKA
ncbi:hypothetical protein PoB_005837100 [Plakobranchus ocellatus]|uniref:Uncharacterized protein n=1 Tax=Plakobranchus ocellatus TaxID=259542 RepID=A0AAV4CGC2_9GAST|nr:hypothetical protein PoB_005837100 [Plakobranchus ocellatus]